MKVKRGWLFAALPLLLAPLFLLWTPARARLLSSGPSPETRGWRLAQELGCFHCHGPEARGGVPNPGHGKIPGLSDFGFLMSVHSEVELREWILEGAPREERAKPGFAAARAQRAAMPAYAGRLSEAELGDLLAWYHVTAGTIYPRDPEAQKGYEAATRLGCFSCHGVGGRLDLPNPGSLAGRIPSWHGEDFAELARDEEEIRAWILDGCPPRLKQHPLARRFLERQVVAMPAYRGRIQEADLTAILAYIRWLRDPSQDGHQPRFATPFTEQGDLSDYGVGEMP